MKKITSIRNLAVALNERPVYFFEIGIKLHKRVLLWEKRNEIKINSGNGIRFITLVK